MTDTTTMTDTAPKTDAPATGTPVEQPATPAADPRGAIRGRGGRDGRRPGGRSPRERAPRERSEFEQATLEVRRVARVMAGGRRFSFSATVVIGDQKGRVGVGVGKGADTALAIDKAVRAAKKTLFTVPLMSDNSIRHDVTATYGSSTVTIIPSAGRGLVAGSAMRIVLEHAGVTNVVTKILTRTKNKLTIARATVAALRKLQSK